MNTPSVALRSLQNEETGIDISVPRHHEEEAPLGGVSILFEISVLTNLELFKTRLHKNEDVVQFSVYKAYREVEDFYNKLNKKYPNSGLPPVPKSSIIGKYTNEEKVAALDRFMQTVSKDVELCQSSIFTHFIGINSQKLSIITTSSVPPPDNDAFPESAAASHTDKNSDDLSDVFHKVTNATAKTGNKDTQIAAVRPKNIDLFEEVKLVRETETNDNKRTSNTGGLFDDFEDENLFSVAPTPKPVSPAKEVKIALEVKSKKKEPEKSPEPVIIDDSQIIIKNRKQGEISLFGEQDLGDAITKEEEALFLVTPENEKSKKNILLFASSAEVVEAEAELQENLDDLLNLKPLPVSPVKKPLQSSEVPEAQLKSKEQTDLVKEVEVEHQPKRPVPLPRKKSLGKSDGEQLNRERPEVMPRKVFLTKPEVPLKSDSSASRDFPKSAKPPPISAKPVLLPKPKPPPKAPKPTLHKDSKDLNVLNANIPENTLENQNIVTNLTDDLNKLDILKYIEQEQKTLDTEPSLFD